MTAISDIDKQIAELKAQKQQMIEAERTAALAKVKDALAELNALGFNYSLNEGKQSTHTTRGWSPVRARVLDTIKGMADGVSRGDLLETMGAKGDKAFTSSISNALANLKKAGVITADSGLYKTV